MYRLMQKPATVLFFLAALCAACTGYMQQESGVAEDEESPSTPTSPDDDTRDLADLCEAIDPSQPPLRRLTEEQYNNTVADLFPFADTPSQTFVDGDQLGNFTVNTTTSVDNLLAEQYQKAAEAVAAQAVSDLDALTGCGEDRTDACARSFIDDVGKRIFRRPLTGPESDSLFEMFRETRATYNFKTGVRMTLEVMLQSPSFLYRLERGEPSDQPVVPLTDYEIATRLSYLLWNSTPDQQLLAAAAEGKLSTADEIEAHARRMLADERARATLSGFYMNWLGLGELDDLEVADDAFDDAMRESMIAETHAFIDQVVWEERGNYKGLLTAPYGYVDKNNAALYGVDAPAEDGMVRHEMDTTRRLGILSQPAMLAAHSEGVPSIYRGLFVFNAFVCGRVGAPPADFDEPPETYEGQPEREIAEARMAHHQCGICHKPMEGLGLAFNEFDGLGRYRTEDSSGNPVSGEGVAHGISDLDEVEGLPALARGLAKSADVERCVSRQWFRYAFAKSASSDADRCTANKIQDALSAANGDVGEVLVAIVRSESFRQRNNPSDSP